MVSVCEESIGKTVTNLMQSERWVRDWLKRHDEGGPDGLRDLPRPGRPRAIPQETVSRIIGEIVSHTPFNLRDFWVFSGMKTAKTPED